MNKLMDLLEGERALYEGLLSVLHREKAAVVDSEIEALNECSKEKENLLLKIRILEEQRVKLLEKLGRDLGESEKDLTLDRLAQRMGGAQGSRLNEYGSNLSALLQSIGEANRTNRDLVSHSLGLVRASFDLLCSQISDTPVYYRSGRMDVSDQSGRFLSGKV